MSYQVIALKWRPQTFEQLIGQSHVGTTLQNALTSGRSPQALLFTGPRGTGKTSTARIYAKALRCTNAVNFVPCQKCDDCIDITESRHLDVVEIDGASNNGVDSIRELRDTVGYMPSSGKYKIYIIDEVHMLSSSAFNALLKTLEEPPPHVIFILATTEIQKIPDTILSRCQRFDFKQVSHGKLAQYLADICQSENIKFEKEALWLIARQGGGSIRDSLTTLDQINTYSKGDITATIVREVLGLTNQDIISRCVEAMAQQDVKALLPVLNDIFNSGADIKIFLQDLLKQIRNALFIKMKAHNDYPIDLPDSEITFLEKITTDLSTEDLHLMFDLTLKGAQNVLQSMEPRLALEMLLLKLAHAPRVKSIATLLNTLQNSAPSSSHTAHDTVIKAKVVKPTATAPTEAKPDYPQARPIPAKEKVTHSDPWIQFVEDVKETNGFLGAMLENTFIVSQNEKTLELGVADKMEFLLEKLEDTENRKRIQNFIKTFWGKDLEIVVAKNKKKENVLSPKQQKQKLDEERTQELRKKIEEDPLVKKTQALFNTTISSIRENI